MKILANYKKIATYLYYDLRMLSDVNFILLIQHIFRILITIQAEFNLIEGVSRVCFSELKLNVTHLHALLFDYLLN